MTLESSSAKQPSLPPSIRLKGYGELFVIGFVILFLKLTCIRRSQHRRRDRGRIERVLITDDGIQLSAHHRNRLLRSIRLHGFAPAACLTRNSTQPWNAELAPI